MHRIKRSGWMKKKSLPAGRTGRRRTVKAHLACEQLETRTVPSTFGAGPPQPVAHDDVADTDGTNPVVVQVLANDTDANGTLNLGSVAIVVAPQQGSLNVDHATGDVTFRASPGFAGTVTFSYTVADVGGTISNVGRVTVVVNPPTANDDFTDTDARNAVAIDVLGNDTDPDGNDQLNPASVAVVSNPAHGSTSVDAGTGAITYTPAAGFSGTDTFTYT